MQMEIRVCLCGCGASFRVAASNKINYFDSINHALDCLSMEGEVGVKARNFVEYRRQAAKGSGRDRLRSVTYYELGRE